MVVGASAAEVGGGDDSQGEATPVGETRGEARRTDATRTDTVVEGKRPAGFVWPPGAEGGGSASSGVGVPVVAAGADRSIGRRARPTAAWLTDVRSALIGFERAVLAPTIEPVERRLGEIGWRPDEPGAYCPRCGGAVGAFEDDEFGCAVCSGERLTRARTVRLAAYGPPIDAWVRAIKFGRYRRAATVLGRELGAALQRAGVLRGVGPGGVVVVPVPMPTGRRLARRIDHTLALARAVSAELGVPMARVLAKRSGPTQLDVPASRRTANVRGTFRVRRGGVKATAGRRVVLIDDVLTTGATLEAAAMVLEDRADRRRRRGARSASEVWAGVVAVTPVDRRAE